MEFRVIDQPGASSSEESKERSSPILEEQSDDGDSQFEDYGDSESGEDGDIMRNEEDYFMDEFDDDCRGPIINGGHGRRYSSEKSDIESDVDDAEAEVDLEA